LDAASPARPSQHLENNAMKFLKDVAVGEKIEVGSYTFTADAIKEFARLYDPQPFHLDEEAAKRSHFGALCASGWHTASMWMRLLVDYRKREADQQRARGEPVAQSGASPGFRDLQWIRPVYVGDTISYSAEVVEKRPLKSRPGWGLIGSRTTGVNQHGQPVITLVGYGFIQWEP
jgi:acyl dehydratase